MQMNMNRTLMLFVLYMFVVAGVIFGAGLCFAQDVGEGVTGANRKQPKAPLPPDMNFDPGPLKVVDSEWMNNKVGLDNKVPDPWIPLKRVGKKISCWDRTYAFDGAFPSAIHGRERDLLSGPMQLVLKVGGETYRLTNNKVTFDVERGDRIEFTATGDLGPLKVTAQNWIEFDGMVQIKFVLKAESELDIEYLGLEIPLPGPVAKHYFFCNGEWGGKPLGDIGAETGWKWGTQWWPISWVGDDDRGLSFVVETTDGWSMNSEAHTHEFTRNQDTVMWNVHIIGKPARIPLKNSYLIGLQGTPMKPMRKDMAAFNPYLATWSAGPKYYGGTHRNTWPDFMGAMYPETQKGINEFKEQGINSINMWWATRWVCFPEFRNPKKIKKAISDWHKAGLSVTQYMSTYFQGYESDVYQRNWKEWAHLRANGDMYSVGYNIIPDGNIGYVTCCPRSSFGDFLIWGIDYLMRTYDIDGLGYIDAPGPLACYNPLHGCTGGTYPIFRDREIFKRWWKIVKKYKPNGYIWAHTSEAFASPIMAYMDAYITGEEFRPSVHPLSDMDKSRLAVTMTGLQWGSQPMFMYQCSGGLQENSTLVSARILPYGATPVISWVDPSIIVPVQKAKIDFGVGRKDTKFYAPHQLPDWLKMNTVDFVIGCWQRADGKVLLIISNFDDKYKNAKIDGAPFEKNGKFAITRDALTGARIMSTHNTFFVSVPGNAFRVILVEPGVGK